MPVPPQGTFGTFLAGEKYKNIHFVRKKLSQKKVAEFVFNNFEMKLGWQDLNLRMTESESVALRLGDTPLYQLFSWI